MTRTTLEDSIKIQNVPGKLERKKSGKGSYTVKINARLCLEGQLSSISTMCSSTRVFLSILMLHELYRTIGENLEMNSKNGPPPEICDL